VDAAIVRVLERRLHQPWSRGADEAGSRGRR
jgi:hypothetical protein